MSPIRIHYPNSDGLDPVFDAYQQLRRLYDAAKPASTTHDCEEYYKDDPAGYCPCEDYIILPGTNEQVNINDSNPLYDLERWLAERKAIELEVEE